MPIKPKDNETKDEYISRCIATEIENGFEQDQAVAMCTVKSKEYFAENKKVSFDYDDTLTTLRGKAKAKEEIKKGNTVYIISARNNKLGMKIVANELGIPDSRIYATGSNLAKVRKIRELGIDKHYDNNSDVIRDIPEIGIKFKAHKRVIFEEDFDEDVVNEYRENGWDVHIRSSRKIHKKDKKVWNKLSNVKLSEDNIVYGTMRQLNKIYDYDLIMSGNDPLLAKLLCLGKKINPKKQVLATYPVESIEDAIQKEKDFRENMELKFTKVVVTYVYEEIPGIPAAKSGSRKFCHDLMEMSAEGYEFEMSDIVALKGDKDNHLTEMGLPNDPFVYRGGFYYNPETHITSVNCRHYWAAKVRME